MQKSCEVGKQENKDMSNSEAKIKLMKMVPLAHWVSLLKYEEN